MKTQICFLISALIGLETLAQDGHWEREMVAVLDAEKEHVILGTSAIEAANWDELQHPRFWQQVMVLSPDSVLINVASTRQVIGKMASRDWNRRTEAEKSIFKDSVRNSLGLSGSERINVTTGKSDFYRFDLVFESLPKGVTAFAQLGVDPWYAQSILLIESPGQIKKSSVGAYGPFQLMPSVARAMGLKVNKYVDERTDFNKSAGAAAKLISKTCIPSARSIAQKAGLTVDESAIWFRLLVMHVYHAGAGNVSAVVQTIGKVPTGEQLIQRMWNTTAASFGNSSQNYSQLALAAHLELADRLARQGKCMYVCSDESN